MYSVGAKILLMADSRRGTIVEVKPGGWYDVKLQPQNGASESGSVSPRSQEIKTLRPTRCGCLVKEIFAHVCVHGEHMHMGLILTACIFYPAAFASSMKTPTRRHNSRSSQSTSNSSSSKNSHSSQHNHHLRFSSHSL